ncbi:hypothetical protein [Salipaludibacillus aurantiacus]|uniref:Uncharacterized protein n=1 Tax=Salipaludibacillus aurantiacus TaxID=1601833 RepID=A0A1H9WCK3_9BACI|nr:hypothetical protein [Salipaludibacillus aurantiacus]SES31519.1 hypothetical protein SAMN05518684_11614 [Salipaludibacillus aurantiacus]
MDMLISKVYNFLASYDRNGYLFDKYLKWFVFSQKYSSFTFSFHYLSAAVYLV